MDSDSGAASVASSMTGDIVRVPKKKHHGRKQGYTVADLPWPRGGQYKKFWRRSFVKLLLAWAGAHEDPFRVNGDLYDVAPNMWKYIFPQIPLGDSDIIILVKVVS